MTPNAFDGQTRSRLPIMEGKEGGLWKRNSDREKKGMKY